MGLRAPSRRLAEVRKTWSLCKEIKSDVVMSTAYSVCLNWRSDALGHTCFNTLVGLSDQWRVDRVWVIARSKGSVVNKKVYAWAAIRILLELGKILVSKGYYELSEELNYTIRSCFEGKFMLTHHFPLADQAGQPRKAWLAQFLLDFTDLGPICNQSKKFPTQPL